MTTTKFENRLQKK